VPVADPGWNRLERFEDLPSQLTAEIGHFFASYKDLDDNGRSTVCGWRDREAALAAEIEDSRHRYRDAKGRVRTTTDRSDG
jgi:inorganic pyrophosphatase